jgi:hypothetical protein
MLSNSPAADPGYQKMYGLRVIDAYQLVKPEGGGEFVDDLESTYKYFAENYGKKDSAFDKFNKHTFVAGHRKMSMSDLWAAKILTRKWDDLNRRENTVEKYTTAEIKILLNEMLAEAVNEAAQQYTVHQEHIDKYGIVIWGHYDSSNKKLYVDF